MSRPPKPESVIKSEIFGKKKTKAKRKIINSTRKIGWSFYCLPVVFSSILATVGTLLSLV